MLTSKAEKLNSMNLLVYMAPMAASIFLPFTLYIEGMWAQLQLRKLEKTDSLFSYYLEMPPLLIWLMLYFIIYFSNKGILIILIIH